MPSQRIITITQTPTITSGSAYASGNALGGLLTFSISGLSEQIKINNVVILDKSNQKSAIDLLLFNQKFTATADKSAIAISSADLLNLEAAISVLAADYATVGTGACATHGTGNNGINIRSLDQNMQLFGQLVARGTPTYGSTTDVVVKLALEIWRE